MRCVEIAKGSEAVIYAYGKYIIKKRLRKKYREKKLDEKLRRERNKREAKLLIKASQIIPVPGVKKIFTYSFWMGRIEGKKGIRGYEYMAGKYLGMLHSYDIIHGDYTPANMIVSGGKLYVIDFGLGFISKRVEDKGDDLFTALRAIPSKKFLEGYREGYRDGEKVMEKVEEIKRRARYM